MKRTLLIMSSGIFLTIAMLVIVWTLVLARTALVQSQDLSVDCSEYTVFPWLVNNPTNCSAYWYCEASDSEPVSMECEAGYYFDEGEQRCIPDIDSSCEDTETPTPPGPIVTDPPEPVPVDPTQPQRLDACDGVLDGRFINNPTGCRSYFECVNGIGLPRQCDLSFNFNEELQICDRPSLTPCTNDDFECPHWGISRWEVPGSCTEFNFCIEGQHLIQTCAPGLVFDPEIALCALQEETDCERELCPQNGGVDDIVTYPSLDENCEEYYMCQGGHLELQSCAPRTHWNQERQRCERPEDALCEVPEPIVIECPPGAFPVNVPHPLICRLYFLCVSEVSYEQECGAGYLFDVLTLQCRIADQATCAEGATLRIGTRKNYLVNHIV